MTGAPGSTVDVIVIGGGPAGENQPSTPSRVAPGPV